VLSTTMSVLVVRGARPATRSINGGETDLQGQGVVGLVIFNVPCTLSLLLRKSRGTQRFDRFRRISSTETRHQGKGPHAGRQNWDWPAEQGIFSVCLFTMLTKHDQRTGSVRGKKCWCLAVGPHSFVASHHRKHALRWPQLATRSRVSLVPTGTSDSPMAYRR